MVYLKADFGLNLLFSLCLRFVLESFCVAKNALTGFDSNREILIKGLKTDAKQF
jgi:hypothetical protein